MSELVTIKMEVGRVIETKHALNVLAVACNPFRRELFTGSQVRSSASVGPAYYLVYLFLFYMREGLPNDVYLLA